MHQRAEPSNSFFFFQQKKNNNNTIKHARKNTMNVSVSSSFPSCQEL